MSVRRILEIAAKAPRAHVPSALSVWDIIDTYYGKIALPEDVFILSKGHAALALYYALMKYSYIPDDSLDHFCDFGSIFGGHPTIEIFGVEATTGSLGHGLPIAVGRALAKKRAGVSGRVTCLIGDGEFNEGSCHESLQLAVHLRLDNLLLVVDSNRNGYVPDTRMRDVIGAHGWPIFQCDGHNPDSIVQAFQAVYPQQPRCVIASTIKGHGVSAMERDPNKWHYAKIEKDQIEQLLNGELI